MEGGGIVFYGSGEVQPGIEYACKYGVVFCEDMDVCWRTGDSWGGLMTESFNGRGTGVIGDDNSFLFGLLSLLLKHWLSRGLFCEDLDDCWQTKDSWCVLMTELLNGGGKGITSDDNSLLFDLLSLLLKHWLSRGLFCEELDDCWWNKDIGGGLMTELFNGGETYINGDDNPLIF